MASPPPPPVSIRRFVPTAQLSNGQPGLSLTPRTTSSAAIIGAGLADDMTVTVTSETPSFQWTGTTVNTNNSGTQCNAFLTGAPAAGARSSAAGSLPPPKEEPSSITVTVGTSTPAPSISLLGPAPILASGLYTIKCSPSGTNRWLVEDSDTSVKLTDNTDDPLEWTFTLVPSNAGNSYTIQAYNGLYLSWDSGNNTVSLVQNPDTTGGTTTWTPSGSSILTTGSTQLYLNGDTSNGSVNLRQDPDSNNGTSWTIAVPTV